MTKPQKPVLSDFSNVTVTTECSVHVLTLSFGPSNFVQDKDGVTPRDQPDFNFRGAQREESDYHKFESREDHTTFHNSAYGSKGDPVEFLPPTNTLLQQGHRHIRTVLTTVPSVN